MHFRDLVIMSWRNLKRNKRRTVITAFSVAFGVLLSVTFTASGDYSYTNMINTSATMGFGHVTIQPQGYNKTPSLAKTITNSETLRKKVAGLAEVEGVFERIVGEAMFATGSKSIGGRFIGIDPGREKEKYNFFLRWINKGQLFAGGNSNEVVIGAKMAEKLKLDLGKKVIYTLSDKSGEMVSGIGRVRGIYESGDDSIDSGVVLLPIEKMREILGYGPDASTLMAVFIEDQRLADEVRNTIADHIDMENREVLTWKSTQAELYSLVAMDRAGNYLMQFLVGLLIAAGILNTLLMSVMERTREFGMMMAVGMSPSKIVGMVIIE